MNVKKEDSFVYENCSICGKDLWKASQIRVDVETDKYVCKCCAKKYNLHTTEAMDYSDEEI
jgi:transposase-like protein